MSIFDQMNIDKFVEMDNLGMKYIIRLILDEYIQKVIQ